MKWGVPLGAALMAGAGAYTGTNRLGSSHSTQWVFTVVFALATLAIFLGVVQPWKADE